MIEVNVDQESQQRFGGIIRLYGSAAFSKVRDSHALIVGIGGVGSWAADQGEQ